MSDDDHDAPLPGQAVSIKPAHPGLRIPVPPHTVLSSTPPELDPESTPEPDEISAVLRQRITEILDRGTDAELGQLSRIWRAVAAVDSRVWFLVDPKYVHAAADAVRDQLTEEQLAVARHASTDEHGNVDREEEAAAIVRYASSGPADVAWPYSRGAAVLLNNGLVRLSLGRSNESIALAFRAELGVTFPLAQAPADDEEITEMIRLAGATAGGRRKGTKTGEGTGRKWDRLRDWFVAMGVGTINTREMQRHLGALRDEMVGADGA